MISDTVILEPIAYIIVSDGIRPSQNPAYWASEIVYVFGVWTDEI